MAKAVVTFFNCIQGSQVIASKDEHLIARVFFKLEIEGKEPINLEADIKQTVGSDYESGPNIEVSQPLGYTGPFNYQAFRDCAEKYYRSQVGSQGTGIRIGPGVTNVQMKGNIFMSRGGMKCEFEIDLNAPGW